MEERSIVKGTVNHKLRMWHLLLVVISLQSALADGLVFQLPEDGTKAIFVGSGSYTITLKLPEHIDPNLLDDATKAMLEPRKETTSSELTVASVGKEVLPSRVDCRWLQLRGRQTGSPEENVLEVLVPEKLCARGSDPLRSPVRTFFNWKDADRSAGQIFAPPGFNRIAYEIERFRPVFPAPLENQKDLPAETLETPAGIFADCRVITGPDQFEGPLLGKGYWEVKSIFTIWLHEDAPFGVVKFATSSETSERSANTTVLLEFQRTFLLDKVERGAARLLPEKVRQDSETKEKQP